nr:hypothetical protein [uncultured Dyadobacter sp.]
MSAVKGRSDKKRRVGELINAIRTSGVTERIIVRESTKAIRAASARAMQITGHVVKAQGGWVVREDKNGKLTKISKIESHARPKKLNLD